MLKTKVRNDAQVLTILGKASGSVITALLVVSYLLKKRQKIRRTAFSRIYSITFNFTIYAWLDMPYTLRRLTTASLESTFCNSLPFKS
jgi:hypothetical protein